MYSCTLDGQVIDEPIDFSSVGQKWYYSLQLSGFLEEVEGSITLTGSDYVYLRTQLLDEVCNTVEFIATDAEGGNEIRAKIFLTDCEWFPAKRLVKCQLVEDGYLSKVDHNKKIKQYIRVGRTKNDIAFTPVEQTDLRYTSVDSLSVATNRKGLRVFDAFDSLIQFMTDGELRCRSDYWDPASPNSSTYAYDVLTTGKEVRAANDELGVYISFEDLFVDLDRTHNLAFRYEVDGSDKYIRIEPKLYFRKSSQGISFDDVNDEIKQSLSKDSFVAKVKMGSKDYSTDFTYLQNIRFRAFTLEEYHLSGQCNLDTELDLSTVTMITDTNMIMKSLPVAQGGGGLNVNDEKIYLVHMNSTNTTFVDPKPAAVNQWYYNEVYTNYSVSFRWFGNIPFPIFAFLGSGLDGAQGVEPTETPFLLGFDPFTMVSWYQRYGLQFTDDFPPLGYDPNGNMAIDPAFTVDGNFGVGVPIWTGSTTVYTAPINQIYTAHFQAIIELVVAADQGTPHLYGVQFQRYNAAGVFIEESPIIYQSNVPSIPGTYDRWKDWDISASFFMDIGDQLIVTVFHPAAHTGWPANGDTQIKILAGARFRINDPLGGEWATYQPNSNLLYLTEFEYPVDCELWDLIREHPNSLVSVGYDADRVEGYITEVLRNIETGYCSVKINGTNI